jgi:hypothetical protein
LPQESHSRFPLAINGLFELLHEPRLCEIAAVGFSDIASAFVSVGADPGNLFERLLSEVMTNSEVYAQGALFEGISTVIYICDKQFAQRFFPQMNRLFTITFENGINRDLCFPIFSAFIEWTRILELDFPYMNFIPSLHSFIESSYPLCRAFAVNSIAVIVSLIEECASEFSLIISIVLDDIQNSSPNVSAIAFDSALILVRVMPSEVIAFLDALFNAASAVITSLKRAEKMIPKLADSAGAIWLALVRVYHIEVSEEDVRVVLERIVFAGKIFIEEVILFITVESERFESVITSLTSLLSGILLSTSFKISMSSEMIFRFAQFAVEHPEEISRSLGYNQNAVSKIQTRIVAVLERARPEMP